MNAQVYIDDIDLTRASIEKNMYKVAWNEKMANILKCFAATLR